MHLVCHNPLLPQLQRVPLLLITATQPWGKQQQERCAAYCRPAVVCTVLGCVDAACLSCNNSCCRNYSFVTPIPASCMLYCLHHQHQRPLCRKTAAPQAATTVQLLSWFRLSACHAQWAAHCWCELCSVHHMRGWLSAAAYRSLRGCVGGGHRDVCRWLLPSGLLPPHQTVAVLPCSPFLSLQRCPQ